MDRNSTPAAAIEALYLTHRQSVLRYLDRFVGDSETAEDLCHETFVKVLLHWDQLSMPSNPLGWLFRIARNTAFDHLRRRRRITMSQLEERHAELVEDDAPLTRMDDSEAIWTALRQLPDHYRVPLLLKSCAGYADEDIAALLGCKPGTVRTRLHRARAHFRASYVA